LITASHSGDSSFNSSQSAAVAQQVAKISTATSLTSAPNPSTFGATVTLTANLAPSAATGAVQFYLGSALLGSGNVIGGRAQLSVSNLPAGSDSLTAAYGGDANYAGSTSGTLVQTVNKGNSTTTLSANPGSPSNSGQTVTFTATVSAAGATGSVRFMDGSTLIGTATLTNGVAVFSTSSLAKGNHSITAVYPGDSNVNPSQSAAMSYKVKP
jgi:hypothetical protein